MHSLPSDHRAWRNSRGRSYRPVCCISFSTVLFCKHNHLLNEWNHDVVRTRYQSEDANKTSCSARNILPVSTCNTFAVFGSATYAAWMNDGWKELTGRTVTVSRDGSWNSIFFGCLYISQLLTFSEFKKIKSKVLSWGVSLRALFFFNDRIISYQCWRILGYSSLLSLPVSHSSGIP